MLILKKVIPLIEVDAATLIILFIPRDPQIVICCLTLSLPLLVSKSLVIIQELK